MERVTGSYLFWIGWCFLGCSSLLDVELFHWDVHMPFGGSHACLGGDLRIRANDSNGL